LRSGTANPEDGRSSRAKRANRDHQGAKPRAPMGGKLMSERSERISRPSLLLPNKFGYTSKSGVISEVLRIYRIWLNSCNAFLM